METDIENVLLYVDDAVRYDALSDVLPEFGPTFRTIAASTHTPTSFGSLLTGLLPTHNGIHSFKHTVPADVSSVFDTPDHTVSLAAEGGMNHSLADMFDPDERTTIESVETPFIHVTRRPGGHAPYDGFDWDTYEYADETAQEYFERAGDDPERTTREYYDGVDSAFQEFQRVLDVLEERGLREETLVVYTSDHGEMLGEYGFFGHTHVATPEVVYVPTTVIHPSLEPGDRDQLLHHIDLLPTIDEMLPAGIQFGASDGGGWVRGGHQEPLGRRRWPRVGRGVAGADCARLSGAARAGAVRTTRVRIGSNPGRVRPVQPRPPGVRDPLVLG